MQGLLIRQAAQEGQEEIHLGLDGRVLLVGADDVFGLPPQRVQRVQLRRTLRQPHQGHPLGRPRRGPGRVGRVLVQQQRHVPAPVVRPRLPQEGLEVSAAPLRARHEQPCPRPQIQRPEDDPPGVLPAQPDAGGFAALGPGGAQRREEQQVGLVFGQHDVAPRQGPDLPADAPFFFSSSGSGSRS